MIVSSLTKYGAKWYNYIAWNGFSYGQSMVLIIRVPQNGTPAVALCWEGIANGGIRRRGDYLEPGPNHHCHGGWRGGRRSHDFHPGLGSSRRGGNLQHQHQCTSQPAPTQALLAVLPRCCGEKASTKAQVEYGGGPRGGRSYGLCMHIACMHIACMHAHAMNNGCTRTCKLTNVSIIPCKLPPS